MIIGLIGSFGAGKVNEEMSGSNYSNLCGLEINECNEYNFWSVFFSSIMKKKRPRFALPESQSLDETI